MTSTSPVQSTAEPPSTPLSKTPIIAIGLDAADPKQIQNWMAAGHLPHLSRLRDRGAYGTIQGVCQYQAETSWNTFLTGVFPQKNGYWGEIKLRPNSYNIPDIQAYDFADYPPFYALGNSYRVAVFDVSKSHLSPQVHGQQMIAWGAHSASTPCVSSPPHLLTQVEDRFGPHPTYDKDCGDWWNSSYLQQLHQDLLNGIQQRSEICQDWLQQEPWDLFLAVFGETHSAGHHFWFVSDPTHPLYSERSRFFQGKDPLLDIYKRTDQAIGKIMAAAPDNAHVLIFSLHGSGPNTSDVPAMFFLAEFLYRFSFPDEPGRIAVGETHPSLPHPCLRPLRKTWTEEIWSRRYDPHPLRGLLRRALPMGFHPQIDRYLGSAHSINLASPTELRQSGNPFFWQPTSWYQPLWPHMQAFALPSFSKGHIRLNIQGREPQGKVAPQGYDRLCQHITEALYALRNPRTGLAVVKNVTRTRTRAEEFDSNLPDADLIVEWNESPTDIVDSPQYGRIGPVPFRRTGSYRSQGFLLVQGPTIEPGSHLPTAEIPDVPATLLTLMGAPVPAHVQGKALVQPCTSLQSPA